MNIKEWIINTNYWKKSSLFCGYSSTHIKPFVVPVQMTRSQSSAPAFSGQQLSFESCDLCSISTRTILKRQLQHPFSKHLCVVWGQKSISQVKTKMNNCTFWISLCRKMFWSLACGFLEENEQMKSKLWATLEQRWFALLFSLEMWTFRNMKVVTPKAN